MTDKIQFDSKEQFINFYKDIYANNPSLKEINSVIDKGYIHKSELQQKVEEAEEMYVEINQKFVITSELNTWQQSYIRTIIEKQHEVIQLFKQSHPEFKENA